jgi:lipoprotein NlpD
MVSKADSKLRICDTVNMSEIWIFGCARCFILALLTWAFVVGCVGPSKPPVLDHSPEFADRQPSRYIVASKDSLYSIAWRYKLDPLDLADWNAIKPPYIIYPGQTLRLTRGSRVARLRSVVKNVLGRSEKQLPQHWQWPVDADAQCCFGPDQKGLNYLLVPGERVVSASAGRVVYSGSGLRGFGHLLILEHADGYLSAYSINTRPSVVEGDTVRVGATLAQIKNGESFEQRFYFEIRHGGSAIDPRKVIDR